MLKILKSTQLFLITRANLLITVDPLLLVRGLEFHIDYHFVFKGFSLEFVLLNNLLLMSNFLKLFHVDVSVLASVEFEVLDCLLKFLKLGLQLLVLNS